MNILRRNKLARGSVISGTRSAAAFTLVETLMSISIMGVCFCATLLAYTRACQRADWSGNSLAAQALSMRQLEEFRAVLWDTQAAPDHDDTTNIPLVLILPLDLPISGTNVTYATNTAVVSNIVVVAGNPSVNIKMITVTTTWPWMGKVYTNTIVNYRAPDQ